MKLVVSRDIRRIDEYAQNQLNIPVRTLMAKSGEAIARAIRERIVQGSTVLILAGKGNNGGDGYVVAQSPPVGTPVREGMTIEFYLE